MNTKTQQNTPKTKQQKQRPIQPLETVWYKYETIFTDNYNFIDKEYKNTPIEQIDVPCPICGDNEEWCRHAP